MQQATSSRPPLGLGLACFNFHSTRPAPLKITGRQYADDLGQTLTDIPAIDDLDLEFEDEFLAYEFEFEEPPPVMNEGAGFFPFWQDGTITFTVHIPERVQEDLLDVPRGAGSGLHTEHFYVSTEWYYEMPVTLIHPLDPTAEPSPRESVIVMRRFLEREIDKTRHHIALDFLGPSPMHAEVFLHPTVNARPQGTPPFVRRHLGRRGFMRYDFEFQRGAYRNDLDAVLEFFHAVKREMDLHYAVVHSEWLRIRSWNAIDERMTDLIAKRRQSGLRGWVQATFKTGRLLTELGIDLVQFEARDISRYQQLSNTFNAQYEAGGGYLREIVEQELRDWTSYPTAQFAALLEQFETRRITDRELIFGLGGVALGALVGVLAG